AVFRRRPAAGFWRRTSVRHGWLFVIHLFLTVPLLLGFLLSRAPRTRRDEAAYRGPRLSADGTWRLQSRESLGGEAGGPGEGARGGALRPRGAGGRFPAHGDVLGAGRREAPRLPGAAGEGAAFRGRARAR